MKINKSYKEAILRAYPTEKDNSQEQESLLHLKQPTDNASAASGSEETPVVETHKNIMRSWLNLRGLDQKMAKSRHDQKKPEKLK